MPYAAPRPCAQPGCPVLVPSGRCDAHRRAVQRADDAGRPSARQRGYDSTWDKLRDQVRAEEQWCRMCGAFVGPAGTGLGLVDHILPLAERPDLRLVRSNLQVLCRACHERKTARE